MPPINKSFKVKKPYGGVLYIEFKDGYYAATTMMRIQEFYESPDPRLRCNHFTVEDLMDSFIERTGKFAYYDDYGGFNVPDYSVEEFFNLYKNSLTKKEDKLFKTILEHTNNFKKRPFYLIATYEKDIKDYLEHEISHALYYLHEEYRDNMNDLVDKCSYRKHMMNRLTKAGYARHVLPDEVQAYLSTSTEEYLKDEWGVRDPKKASTPFKEYFKEFKKSLV